MRRILLALVCIAGLSASAYAQVGRTLNLVTGAKIAPLGVGIDLRGAGITQHEIVWNVIGTVSGCSVKVEKSADGSSWSDLIAGATCTSNGNSSLTAGIANFVRVNATTLTGTGTLSVRYLAFAPGLPSSATIAGDVNVTNSGTFAVQVTSVVPGTGATNLGKAEDGAPANGDTLVPSGCIVQATLSATTSDTKYGIPKCNPNSAMWVQSVFVDAAEGAPIATNPVPIGCVYRTTYTALDVGDVGYPICDVSSRLMTVPTPGIQGGWTALNATAADGATACTSTAQAIKASQGTFGGYFINNPNTADSWLHIYNVASGSVTVGTTNPALTFRIPGQAANSVGANLEISLGVQFSTAMSMACTTTAAGNGNPANALEADIFFK